VNRILATICSFVFHPLLITSMLVTTLAFVTPELIGQTESTQKLLLIGLVFTLTFVLPVINIAILKFTSNISKFSLAKREERIFPMVLTSVYYGFCLYFLVFQIQAPDLLIVITGAITATVVLLTIITFYWKISIHSAGIWGSTGILLAIQLQMPGLFMIWPLVSAIILAGIVSSSRLFLGAHNPKQIFAGGGLGFAISFLSLYFFW